MAEREELINLRVSVARIAQVIGLQDMIPGVTDANGHLPFEELHRLATEHRGWNFLCAMIVVAIQHGLETGANLSLRGIAEPADDFPQVLADMLREARASSTGLSPAQVDALSKRFFGVTFEPKGDGA